MKRLAIIALAILLVSLATCIASSLILGGILEEAHAITTEVFTAMNENDPDSAREGLVELATIWEEKADLLAILCSHDDLHEVKSRIIQAEICMEYTDMEDFYSSVSLIGEAIEHILDKESLTLSNLY